MAQVRLGRGSSACRQVQRQDAPEAVEIGGESLVVARSPRRYRLDEACPGLVTPARAGVRLGRADDRIAKRGRDGKGWEMNQLAAAGTILGRGIPMLFMGQEAGETMQFGQDTDKLPAHSPGAHEPGAGNN